MMTRTDSLLDGLAAGVVVADGAMGSLLADRGADLSRGVEWVNLAAPVMVQQIHEEYIRAGAQLIETNTFAAGKIKLSAHGLESQQGELIQAAVECARAAAGTQAWVAGSIGPSLLSVEPMGDQRAACEENLTEHIEALLEEGVDAILLETFSDVDELLLGVKIARARTELPIIAQLVFGQGGSLPGGSGAVDVARELHACGANVVGANCGLGWEGPAAAMAALSQLPPDAPYRSVSPNAGFAQHLDGRQVYLSSPDYFAERTAGLIRQGARLVGGCCGTSPETIAALSRRLASTRTARTAVQVTPVAESVGAPAPVGKGAFLERIPDEQATIIELAPPKQLNVEWPIEFAQRAEAAGADAISLPENPLARIRMDGFLLAQHLKGVCNLPLIPHLTCRDRNLLGLHSTLMGGAIAGLDGVLAVTGDPLNPEARQGRSVYDISSTGLVRMIAEMNAGRTLAGADLKGHSNYSVGVAYSTSAPNIEKETDRLVHKLDAGAQFVMTQPVFTADDAKQMLDHLDARKVTARVFVGVYPLLSYRSAWFMHHQVPGVEIPATILDRLSSVSDDYRAQCETGLAEYRQLRAELSKLNADIYLICPPASGSILESLLESSC